MRVNVGGVVTHAIRLLEGLRLDVGDSLVVNGEIDVIGKGLSGGPGGIPADRLGEAYDPVTEAIVKATPEVAGGSHGGLGGGGFSPVYGSEVDPRLLGSGGGGGAQGGGGQPGGKGGGMA